MTQAPPASINAFQILRHTLRNHNIDLRLAVIDMFLTLALEEQMSSDVKPHIERARQMLQDLMEKAP